MNREIKFRAWDKSNNMMGEVTSLNFYDELVYINEDATGNTKPVKIKDVTLMQFTGFTDAGHEDLYEGDIFEDEGEWFHIEWSDEDGAWWAMAINGGVHMQLSEFAGSSTCWKQGNIFEHPHLVSSKESEI